MVAAGSSTRFGSQKLLAEIGGRTVLEHSLLAFERSAAVNEIVLVTGEQLGELAESFGFGKLVKIVEGGETRAASVKNGVGAASGDIVLIHDAARPFVSLDLIQKIVVAAKEYGAAAPFVGVTDTVKMRDGDFVGASLHRPSLIAAQTPQAFFTRQYAAALKCACGDETDDCEIAAKAGIRVRIVDGERENIKITRPEDIRALDSCRIGHGYDVHRFAPGRRLVLCGVEIPFEQGLSGHSDADAATHALIDAMLGAAGLGDIGAMFPDSDERYRGIYSIELLKAAAARVADAGYRVGNADVTVVAQRPKLAEFIPLMRHTLADACGVAEGSINVKATTEEGLGFTGEMQGIAAHAVVLLARTPFSTR